MLIKMLPKDDRVHLLELASLLSISDKPLLWDGKPYEEITAENSLDQISIRVGEEENELIDELRRSADLSCADELRFFTNDDMLSRISERLVKLLKNSPLVKMADPGTRVWAGTTVLLEMLAGKKYDLPSTPKIILYELFLVSLRDGHISGIEWALLKEFQRFYNLEDFIFDDLLGRAETLNKEITKTIAIILE
ncbi:hypothetical protein KUV41_17280 [Halomonas sp. DP8Y7-1]|uniref:hypothetical protein n=1 Tax=Halomonas sp. DP8Y7-1 TaxID=2859078 RepID=UPI001C96E151|nr:hypothetical protein [Halomonas sp. DP8Y7-1]MBY6031114.1 hypothetical protein [Halomonas sp. DP8Y7-1]